MGATCTALYTPRDARNMRVFNYWLFAAMLTFAAATILIGEKLIGRELGWALTGLTIGLLVMMVRAYIVFLRAADELLRKVQLEALALALGASVVFMLGYRLCERLGAMKLDLDDPLLLIAVVFAIGQWLGIRRYAGGGDE
jgi:hypothetical protein